ncbi:MAG: Ig-like domain-containing protein [Thermoplasmata archaeon]|nr:Ig-like domain-containing protein [Thermoplasmata archaeon]
MALFRVGSKGLSIVFAFFLVSSILIMEETRGHSEVMSIYSTYDLSPVTVDGIFESQEWENSTFVDMREILWTTLDVYLYVKNNETHVFFLYDAWGDSDPIQINPDSAGISFDGDHDGALTQHGDHEFTITSGSSDPQCIGYNSPRCHFIYESNLNQWIANDDMNETLPYQQGLAAAAGFGPSDTSPTSHRIYEFSVPIALLGQPSKTVVLGDVVGFFAGKHMPPSPDGVRDGDTAKGAIWPDKSLAPNDYGDLHIGEPVNLAVEPDFQTLPAAPGEAVIYPLRIRNVGTTSDSYDLEGVSTKGWNISFYDPFMTPLSDDGGMIGLVDVGPVSPGLYVNIRVEVEIPAGAAQGEMDFEQITASSWTNTTQVATALLRTGVPNATPWLDYLEFGSEGWYVYPRNVTDWELGTPSFAYGPPLAHSGSNLWGTKLSSNYTELSNSYLYSPFLEIPDFVTESYFYFWHWYDIVGSGEDGAWVEMSMDGGPFELISPVGGYPDLRFGAEPAYSQSSGDWVQAEFNMSSAIGSTVCFRFRFWDFSNLFQPNKGPNKVAPGWYLDDFEIASTGLPSGVIVSPDHVYDSVLGGEEATYELFVENNGTSPDTFDITVNSSLGWDVKLYDAFWNPLPDTESPPDGIPDTNRLSEGEAALIRVNVSVPFLAQPGESDITTFVADSSTNLSVSASATIETQVPYPIPLFDDMENGTGHWIADGLWHQVRNVTGTEPPWNITYSGSHSWWYGQDPTGDYDTGGRTSGNLTSPPINLMDTLGANLSFRYWYETEQTLDKDQRWLLLKVGDSPWQKPGDPGAIQLDLRPEGIWLEWKTNLSTYVGNIVRVRFHFDSIDNLDNVHQGWYIDDFLIEETIPMNHPPMVSIVKPEGGESFSYASSKEINWTVSDDSDAPEDMMLWLNYSVTGEPPWTPIAGAQGIPSTDGFLWTVPQENSNSVVLRATVSDSGGLVASGKGNPFEIDGTAPFVYQWEPQGLDALTNDPIIVSFSETMNRSSLTDCLSIKRMGDWSDVLGETSIYDNKTIVFVPAFGLVNGAWYQVNVSSAVKDDSDPGLHLAENFTWAFRVNVTLNTPPRGTISEPGSGTVWTGGSDQNIQFSVFDSQDSSDLVLVWLNYSSSGNPPWEPIPNAQGIPGDTSVVTWSLPAVDSTSVAVNLTVVDSDGLVNWTTSEPFEIDSTPPEVVDYGPNGTGVSISTSIWASFSENMNGPSVEGAFRVVKSETGSEVIGTYSWIGNRIFFYPVVDLSIGTDYRGIVYTSAMDDSVLGNRLQEQFEWNFSTAVGDSIPPTVLSTFPLADSTDVSVDIGSISIRFNESMNMPSVMASITIVPSIEVGFSWTNDLITISPMEELPYNTGITVLLNATGAMDLAGNPLDGNGDGVPGDDFILHFWTEEEPSPEEVMDVIPYIVGAVMAVIIILFVLYLLRGRTGPEEEEEEEPEEEEEEEEEVDVEEELKDIDELLRVEEY